MSREHVFRLVSEMLLQDTPEEDRVPISEQTNPFTDLGKDSYYGVEFACLLSMRLNIEIPSNENPLVEDGDKKTRARTVGEIADWCLSKIQNKQG